MGDSVKLFTYNILEAGTVTVTGTADTGYPVTRLYDRSVNLLWKYTTGATAIDQFLFGEDDFLHEGDGFTFEYEESQKITFQVDQGSNVKGVDLLYIAGHNFSTRTMSWDYSSDGSAWATQESWTQSGNGVIVKTIPSALNKQYWRVMVQAHVNPQCGEIIMAEGSAFQIQSIPNPIHSYQSNVVWAVSVGGQERGVKLGNKKARRDYGLSLNGSELATFQSRIDDLDEFSRPFLVLDKASEYFMMCFDPIPSENYTFKTSTDQRTKIEINLLEIL